LLLWSAGPSGAVVVIDGTHDVSDGISPVSNLAATDAAVRKLPVAVGAIVTEYFRFAGLNYFQ
jgi:hypothetical protein